MEFKPLEIAAIAIAIAIPIGLFIVLLVPGAGAALMNFALDRTNMPFVFGGAAAITTAVLGWRIYRRIRPANRRRD